MRAAGTAHTLATNTKKIQLEKNTLTMMYGAKKTQWAVQFYYPQMAAAAAGMPVVLVQKKAAKKEDSLKHVPP